MTSASIRVAAVQLEAVVGDVDANLERCARLAEGAALAGAQWIVLPEFFSTGIANLPELSALASPPDGAATRLLRDLAVRHGAWVGGSALVQDADGHVRNAFLLAGPDGTIAGRHDKDIPTLWENAVYVGGTDSGRIRLPGIDVGVALCWELMRTRTVSRLAGEVDLVLGGSGWWSIPQWAPRAVSRRLEAANRRRALAAPACFATYVGAPLVHAAHSGRVECPFLPAVARYSGYFEGGASICGPSGEVLALRTREEGPGWAIADVTPRRERTLAVPHGFWLQRRGAPAALGWAYQNPIGARRYRMLLERRGAVRRMTVLERPGVPMPVVQAGLGGGLSRHELAAAVSDAGGLGPSPMTEPQPSAKSSPHHGRR